MKNVQEANRTPLDTTLNDVEQTYFEQLKEDDIMMCGFMVAFMEWTMSIVPKLNGVFSMDGCHGRTHLNGTFFHY